MTAHHQGWEGIDRRALGATIEGRLKHDGDSQRAAADRIGVSFSTISRAINQVGIPDLQSYIRICRWLQLSLDTFVLPEEETP